MNDDHAARGAPELLPCPFCGAIMEDWHGQSFTHPLVETREEACILAGLSFSYQHSRWNTEEVLRWNRRATPTALAASPEGMALIAEGMERAAEIAWSIRAGVDGIDRPWLEWVTETSRAVAHDVGSEIRLRLYAEAAALKGAKP